MAGRSLKIRLIEDVFLERRHKMATVVIQKCKGKRGISYAVRYRDPLSGKKKHYKSYRKYKEAHQSANDLRSDLNPFLWTAGMAPLQTEPWCQSLFVVPFCYFFNPLHPLS